MLTLKHQLQDKTLITQTRSSVYAVFHFNMLSMAQKNTADRNANRKVFLKIALLARWSPQPFLSKKQGKSLELFKQEKPEELLEILPQSNFVSYKSHTEGNGKQISIHCMLPRRTRIAT
jgi:LAS superfamily LD-carboxypeptidase LdcB